MAAATPMFIADAALGRLATWLRLLGYDTVYLLVDAIKRAGSTDSAAVKTAIEGTKDFKGITGAITFSADSHVPQKGVTVIAVKGGKFTLGGEVVPEKVPAP